MSVCPECGHRSHDPDACQVLKGGLGPPGAVPVRCQCQHGQEVLSPLMAVMAEVLVQVERDGWEPTLAAYGFDPADVEGAMRAAVRRERDAATMLCVGLVAGALHEQNVRAMLDSLTEDDPDG